MKQIEIEKIKKMGFEEYDKRLYAKGLRHKKVVEKVEEVVFKTFERPDGTIYKAVNKLFENHIEIKGE